MDALEIFRIVATEFSEIPDDDYVEEETGKITRGVKTYMDLYKDQISLKRFGKSYEKALAFLTAHKLKMAGYGNNSGLGSIAETLRVSSVSEGETSVSFNNNNALQPDAEYALTIYGQEFLTLRRQAVMTIISAGEAHV